MISLLALPSAVGNFRLADAAGAYVDRAIGDDPNTYYLRLGNSLRADLSIEFFASEIAVAYGLRLMPDQNNYTTAPFHTAELRYTYATPRFSFNTNNFIGIGEQTFTGVQRISAPGTLTPPADPSVIAPTTPTLATPGTIDSSVLPGARTLLGISARVGAGLGYRLDRRLKLTLAAGYGIYGGLGREAQKYLALQHSIDTSVSLGYALGPRFTLATGLMGTRGWNSTDQDFWLFTLSETALYKAAPHTDLDLGVGVSSRATDTPVEGARIVNTPVGAAGITHTLRGRDATGSLRASVTYAPMVDAVSARILNRFLGTGSASIATGDVRAGLIASFSQATPTDDPDASTVVSGSIFGGYQFTSWLGATLGAAVARQHFTAARTATFTPALSGVSWSVFAGLFAVSPTWRF